MKELIASAIPELVKIQSIDRIFDNLNVFKNHPRWEVKRDVLNNAIKLSDMLGQDELTQKLTDLKQGYNEITFKRCVELNRRLNENI